MKHLQFQIFVSLLSSFLILTLFGLIPTSSSRVVSSSRNGNALNAGEQVIETFPASEYNLTELDSHSLQKRGQCTKEGNKWICANTNVPTIAETRELGLKKEILQANVGRQYFYTNLDGEEAIVHINKYCACKSNEFSKGQRCVGYKPVVETGWVTAEANSLNRLRGQKGTPDSIGRLLMPRVASQALAEECSGDVAFFTKSDAEPGELYENPEDVTWIGWEFPALTQNAKVERILRIDPREGQDHTPKVIWSKGDEKQVPRGVDETVKPLRRKP
ncbi:hypothetical protein DL95DRAFT_417820 [Leptodontidium sp. 2 PMI_412]|nr:hypothetical protein DL95DRAFT_417820 [Leptodontidium sp. 2 PMI_412]